MTEAEFNRLAAAGYNRIPLVLETFADLDTPLSIYLKLANQPYTYLLESVVGGERFGRYSFIGLAADTRIEVRGYQCTEFATATRSQRKATADDPLDYVEQYLARFKVAHANAASCRVFAAGWSAISATTPCATSRKSSRTRKSPTRSARPDILLLLSEEIAIVDNLSGKLSLVVYAEPGAAGCFCTARARGWPNCCRSCASRW